MLIIGWWCLLSSYCKSEYFIIFLFRFFFINVFLIKFNVIISTYFFIQLTRILLGRKAWFIR